MTDTFTINAVSHAKYDREHMEAWRLRRLQAEQTEGEAEMSYPTEEEQDRMEARAAERLTLEREAAANFAFYAGESEDVTF